MIRIYFAISEKGPYITIWKIIGGAKALLAPPSPTALCCGTLVYVHHYYRYLICLYVFLHFQLLPVPMALEFPVHHDVDVWYTHMTSNIEYTCAPLQLHPYYSLNIQSFSICLTVYLCIF